MDIDQAQLDFSQDSLFLLNVSLGVIIYGVALNLEIKDFKRILEQPKAVLVGYSSQVLLLPAITALLVYLLNPPASVALGMIMVASCPGGNISNFIAFLARANAALSVSLTAVSSVLAVVITPLNFMFWSSTLPLTQSITKQISIDFWDLAATISLTLLIPIILGMSTQRFFRKAADVIRKPVKYLSLMLFAAILIIAIFKNLDLFKDHWFLFISAVVLHNGLAFLTGFSWAKMFKLKEADLKAVTVETGIQNSALALVLIFAFFDGLGGMAIIAAFWGVWHIVAGIILAFWWQRATTS